MRRSESSDHGFFDKFDTFTRVGKVKTLYQLHTDKLQQTANLPEEFPGVAGATTRIGMTTQATTLVSLGYTILCHDSVVNWNDIESYIQLIIRLS